ncbi:hypothetical protein, partial [[Ruminococcus] torques]|uniref:hypothetical protein n=1 Tax=[Ruminococcus] torques TaxID=33039 RepID=UPI001EDEE4D1
YFPLFLLSPVPLTPLYIIAVAVIPYLCADISILCTSIFSKSRSFICLIAWLIAFNRLLSHKFAFIKIVNELSSFSVITSLTVIPSMKKI